LALASKIDQAEAEAEALSLDLKDLAKDMFESGIS
jgi:hypothetical protein